jgi:hypothetical protein
VRDAPCCAGQATWAALRLWRRRDESDGDGDGRVQGFTAGDRRQAVGGGGGGQAGRMRMSCQFGRNRTDADAQAGPNKEAGWLAGAGVAI